MEGLIIAPHKPKFLPPLISVFPQYSLATPHCEGMDIPTIAQYSLATTLKAMDISAITKTLKPEQRMKNVVRTLKQDH